MFENFNKNKTFEDRGADNNASLISLLKQKKIKIVNSNIHDTFSRGEYGATTAMSD